MSLFQKCYDYKRVEQVKAFGLYPYFRPIQESEGPVVMMEGRKVVMAGSNNYLGLTTHPAVQEAAIKATEKYGTGCSGSRFLTGTIDLHISLEHKLAKFMGKEAALLYSTGFQTAQGVLAPLLNRGDYLISDEENHASIIAGALIVGSKAKVLKYKHNDVQDLERVLQSLPLEAGKLLVTDGVFSTFGDIAPLKEISQLAKTYNAQLLVDDAHGLGVIGEGGRGTASHFDVVEDTDLIMCTFSKTLASLGGFVAGPERVISYLKHHSPALIFSASPTPASVAAADAALELLIAQPELVNKLQQNAAYVRNGLTDVGYQIREGQTAIVPVNVGDDFMAFQLWRMLYDSGVFVNAFIHPATPKGQQMMRTSYMATHERHHLDQVINNFEKVGKKLRLIEDKVPVAQAVAVGMAANG